MSFGRHYEKDETFLMRTKGLFALCSLTKDIPRPRLEFYFLQTFCIAMKILYGIMLAYSRQLWQMAKEMSFFTL